MANQKVKQNRQAPLMRPHAAGTDIGAEEIYVAVPRVRMCSPSVASALLLAT
jgi:hypothetical protein